MELHAMKSSQKFGLKTTRFTCFRTSKSTVKPAMPLLLLPAAAAAVAAQQSTARENAVRVAHRDGACELA